MDGQHQVIDLVFQRDIVGDESGHFHGVLDSVEENGWIPPTAMALVYGFYFHQPILIWRTMKS
jgi:hypothetical protein